MENTEHTETTESISEPTESTTEQAESATESAAPAAAGIEAAAPPSAAIVDAWFTKHFHNMGALFDERTYALLIAAKEDLKTILVQPAP